MKGNQDSFIGVSSLSSPFRFCVFSETDDVSEYEIADYVHRVKRVDAHVLDEIVTIGLCYHIWVRKSKRIMLSIREHLVFRFLTDFGG